jgi:hypothetical protein
MAMSAAERQRAYRQRRASAGEHGERRISAWVSTRAYCDLHRLAAHNGLTVREVIEELIRAEVERLVATLDDEQFERFLSAPARTRRGTLRRNEASKASTPTSEAEALEPLARDAERSEGGALSP